MIETPAAENRMILDPETGWSALYFHSYSTMETFISAIKNGEKKSHRKLNVPLHGKVMNTIYESFGRTFVFFVWNLVMHIAGSENRQKKNPETFLMPPHQYKKHHFENTIGVSRRPMHAPR